MKNRQSNNKRNIKGYFGEFGGCFAPETLMPALHELEDTYRFVKKDRAFLDQYHELLKKYNGRPTPLYYSKRLSSYLRGARIYLKREDLNHTGAHKITNSLGQGLIAQHMGKKRLIAETGAGQHGVATATAAALLGLECSVYMGTIDMQRQRPNVFRMKLLGAEVIPVDNGSKTLKDAVNDALRDWTKNVRNTHYVLGSALGPHPYPTIVRDFQSIIGIETRKQILKETGRLPDTIIACVGGGSNAIGIFNAFKGDLSVKLIGVEAGGLGLKSQQHAVRLTASKKSRKGVFHGFHSYVLQDTHGQIANTHSVSAGLDYSSVGPEHAWLNQIGRAQYTYATDTEALNAFTLLCQQEGIIPALESAHAVAHAIKIAPQMSKKKIIVINLSGRGDKDIHVVADHLGFKI